MKLVLTIIALLSATAAYAACTSHSYSYNGKVIVCTRCCDHHGNCNEVCS